MNILREAIGWLVAASGLFCWILFWPQIKLLRKVKRSESNSLWLTWGSFVMQAITLIHILLQPAVDWKLASVYVMSIAGVLSIALLIHYYRRFPGSRT